MMQESQAVTKTRFFNDQQLFTIALEKVQLFFLPEEVEDKELTLNVIRKCKK